MKIIDLLNKIANGEEVPEYVQYYNMLQDKLDTMMVCKENIYYKLSNLEIQINSRVEPVEEPKGIPEKLDLYVETQNILREDNYKLVYHDIHKSIVSLMCKYNQLIDYLKSKGE